MEITTKEEIRRFIIEKRDSFDENTRKEWNEEITSRVINSEEYKNAKVVFSFVSFGSEVDTKNIILNAICKEKIVCVPKVNKKEKVMNAVRLESLDDLKPGYFGILEPSDDMEIVDPALIDLIIMPGVAFDRNGGRVGYGGGFYDKFISRIGKKIKKIAVAYDFQVLGSVPVDEYDALVDGVITNKEIIVR